MNKKTALLKPPSWDSAILPKLKSVNYGKDEGQVKALLNDPSKIIFEATSPQDNPGAVAWVTTEDIKDGVINEIHINATKIPTQPDQYGNVASQIIASISSLISHEVAHLRDFRNELYQAGQDPFPGGEGVAEQAERAQYDRAIKTLSSIDKTKSILVKLSNTLDRSGNAIMADRVDGVLYIISKKEGSIKKEAKSDESAISDSEAFMFSESFFKAPFGRL